MSPTRKLLPAAAAVTFVLLAGCAATTPHTAQQPRTRTAPDPAVLAAMERQMLHEARTGVVQLGASDALGRSLHDRHVVIAMTRELEGAPLHAGVDSSKQE